MMVKIKGLYLNNFKGVDSILKIDFSLEQDVKLNILSGPNGFGKTTLFDAIEICLTSNFHRVKMFENIQKKTTSRIKPFYQNTIGKDVILKLWIQNEETGVNHIITKHFDDNLSPRSINFSKYNIPVDSTNFFKTYITNDTSLFEINEFENQEEVNQQQINSLIFGDDSENNIESTYYLFNYLQQEDNIYFLRQEEAAKGESLGFLFNTEKQERKLQVLDSILLHLKRIIERDKNRIGILEASVSDINSTEYDKIFIKSDTAFDSLNPFNKLNLSEEQLSIYSEELNNLIEFRNNFNVLEYNKSIIFSKIQKNLIDNLSLLEAFTLKEIYSEDLIRHIEYHNNKINKARLFLSKDNKVKIEKEYFDLFLEGNDSILDAYEQLSFQLSTLNKDLGEIDLIIFDLNESRSKAGEEFKKIKHLEFINDNHCPLCDSPFESFNTLLTEIDKKTKQLLSFNKSKLDAKIVLTDAIEKIYNEIISVIIPYLEKTIYVDEIILDKLKKYPNYASSLILEFGAYEEFFIGVTKQFNFEKTPINVDELNTKVVELQAYIKETIQSKYIYKESEINNKHLYSSYFEENEDFFGKVSVERLRNKLAYVKNQYNVTSNNQLATLKSKFEKLKKIESSTTSIYSKLKQTIKDHKGEMIKSISIPFFIYSGKILQSYQQGLGIFIDIHETGQNNNVRFFTGPSSDHDIVYHLSSGQMAVVSIAFCLSLNKVYNTNQHFKFLAIDDPIQTMDDLNIHTFIELLRNEFSDYQMIISTHDDFTSRYMKYKFDKFNINTKIQNIQQLTLNQSNS